MKIPLQNQKIEVNTPTPSLDRLRRDFEIGNRRVRNVLRRLLLNAEHLRGKRLSNRGPK